MKGIRIEGSVRPADHPQIRTRELVVLDMTVHNERDCDIEQPRVRVVWEGDGLKIPCDLINEANAGRIRASSSYGISGGALRVPDEWQGQECYAHIEVWVGGQWQQERTLPFKVEDVGMCDL